jgi:endonuclease/exonuclease/phosphatase family metal-dependent hydrolase
MNDFSFLTYNMLQKPIGMNSVANEYKTERLKLFCDHYLLKFDILALQECFDSLNSRPYNFLKRSHKAGFKYFCKNPEPSLRKMPFVDGGLLILSKFPIIESDHVFYPESITADRIMAKGALWSLIDIPHSNSRLHVFNTHMQAFFSKCSDSLQIQCHIRRIEQIMVLKDFIKKTLATHFKIGDLVLLAGDLNINALNCHLPFNDILSAFDVDQNILPSLCTSSEFDFYKRIFEFNNASFKINHAFHEDLGYYPVTCGRYFEDEHGKRHPFEDVITDSDDRFDNAGLDYVLELKIVNGSNSVYKSKLNIRPGSLKVEEFLVKHHILTQLSDHFGISMKIYL